MLDFEGSKSLMKVKMAENKQLVIHERCSIDVFKHPSTATEIQVCNRLLPLLEGNYEYDGIIVRL